MRFLHGAKKAAEWSLGTRLETFIKKEFLPILTWGYYVSPAEETHLWIQSWTASRCQPGRQGSAVRTSAGPRSPTDSDTRVCSLQAG